MAAHEGVEGQALVQAGGAGRALGWAAANSTTSAGWAVAAAAAGRAELGVWGSSTSYSARDFTVRRRRTGSCWSHRSDRRR